MRSKKRPVSKGVDKHRQFMNDPSKFGSVSDRSKIWIQVPEVNRRSVNRPPENMISVSLQVCCEVIMQHFALNINMTPWI